MTGGVFFLDEQSAAPFGKHPCVVVLEIAGSAECIVVPAFSVGRETVEGLIGDLARAGLPRDAIAVTLDNRQCISLSRKVELHDAHWMVAQHQRLSLSVLRRGTRVGTMNMQAMRLLANALCKLADARPNEFSPHILKKLRRLAGGAGQPPTQP